MPDGFPEVGIWQSRHSLMVLDVTGGSHDNGAPIIQWDSHGGNNQLWQIVIPSARPGPRPGGAVPFD